MRHGQDRQGEPRPTDVVEDLAEIATQISSLKGEAMNWLLATRARALSAAQSGDAHAAVEAKRQVRLNQ
jgi:hypothetical protein